MAIISKGSVVKGEASTFTLNKTDLAANSIVAADAYFSVQANWKRVVLFYQSPVGNQPEIVRFDATQTTPTASFLVSENARDIFEIKKITIFDNDGGWLVIPRESLTVAGFDLDLTEAPSAQPIVWDTTISGYTLGANGKIGKYVAVGDYGAFARSSEALTGDFELEFRAYTLDPVESTIDWFQGWAVGASPLLGSETGTNLLSFTFDSGAMKVYANGGFGSSVSLLGGENVFKVKRTGSSVELICNDVVIVTYPSYGLATLYASTRLGGRVSIATVLV